MSNNGTTNPYGLTPVWHIDGSPWNGAVRQFYIANAQAASIFAGDPVVFDSNNKGTIRALTAADIEASTAILGVFQGCSYQNPTALYPPQFVPAWIAGSTVLTGSTVIGYVTIDPGTVYAVQTNSTVGLVLANIGQNCALVTGTGNTSTGQSGLMLNISTAATTATLNTKIIALSDDVLETFGTPYNDALVTINNSTFSSGVVGAY